MKVTQVSKRFGHLLARVPDASGWQLFASVFSVHLIVSLAVGEVAWDDGYITLAFARTYAETGHIGLTPFSETVEGATSPLWFLLMAAIYKLGITSFYGFHLASQLIAAVCAATAAVLLYRLVRPSAPAAAWLIAFLALILGPFRTETANGMEMTLLCVVVLWIMCFIRDQKDQPLLGLMLLSAVVPLVRFEAAGYLVVGATGIMLFSKQIRVGLAIILSTLSAMLLVTFVRYIIFGTLGLTNTMIAKQASPYSPPFGTPAWNLQLVVGVLIEPIATFLPALVVCFVLSRISGVKMFDRMRELANLATSRRMPARVSFALAYALAFIGVTVVLGSNYFAPPGRMGASALLALIVAAAIAFPVKEKIKSVSRRTYAAVGALFLVPFVGILAQDLAWFYIARLNTDTKLAFNSTVAYRENGEAADHVRDLLQLPKVSVLVADVGATSLCCERLEILDLGLLANRELSSSGWGGFAEYLRERKPDLIQTHGVWSQESEIYDNPDFKLNYTPVVVYDSLFYLRNDHFDVLKTRCVDASTSEPYFYAGLEPASSRKDVMPADQIDKAYVDSLGLANFCRLA